VPVHPTATIQHLLDGARHRALAMGLAPAETLRAATFLAAADGLLFGGDHIEDVAADGARFWIASLPAAAASPGDVGPGGEASCAVSAAPAAVSAASTAVQQPLRDMSTDVEQKAAFGAASMPSPMLSAGTGRDAASPRMAVVRGAVAAAALRAARQASPATVQPLPEFDIHVRAAAGTPSVPMRVTPATTFGELVGLIAKKDAFPKQHIRLLVDGREHAAKVTLAEAGVVAGTVLQKRLAPTVGYVDID